MNSDVEELDEPFHKHVPKKRSESYNNQRKAHEFDDANANEQDIKYEFIQSRNFKGEVKGKVKQVRAPSSGSSGSQPRVQVANKTTSSGGQLSVNSSGVQRRYDSIEH